MNSWKSITVLAALFASCALADTARGEGRRDRGDKAGHMHEEKVSHSHKKSAAHGGAVTMSEKFHIETVFLPKQIRLYFYDSQQNPIHVMHPKRGIVKATGVVEYRDKTRETDTLEFVHAVPGDYVCADCCGYRSRKAGKCGCGMKLKKEKIPETALYSCPMHPGQNGKGPGKCPICGMAFTLLDYLSAEVDLKGLSSGDARVAFDLKNLPGEKEQTLQFTQKFAPPEKHEEHKIAKKRISRQQRINRKKIKMTPNRR